MGKDGYFTTGITNLSYNASLSQFLTGGAAMMYMGTWLLAQINSSENTQGNNIGFMPFPAVTGGAGSINQYPANTGSPNVINPNVFGPNAQAWLRCIAQNYGSASLKDQGTFSGFRCNTAVSGLDAHHQVHPADDQQRQGQRAVVRGPVRPQGQRRRFGQCRPPW